MASQWKNRPALGTSIADGTAISVANSNAGGDSALSRFLTNDLGVGNSALWKTGLGPTGGRVWQLNHASANKEQLYVALPTTYSTGFWMYVGFSLSAAPSASFPMIRTYADTGYNAAGSGAGNVVDAMQITTGLKIFARDTAAAVSGSTSTGTLSAATQYLAVLIYDPATNTFTQTVYPWGNGSATATASVAIATDTTVGSFSFGYIGSAATGISNNISHLEFGDTATPVARPDLTNSPPTVTLHNTQTRYVQVGATLTDLTFDASDTDGTITNITASVLTVPPGGTTPSITNGTLTGGGTASASRPFTATFGSVGTTEIKGTATDDGGLTNSSTVKYIIQAYPTIPTPTIITAVDVAGAAQYGGQANLAVAVSDNDDTTGVETPNNPLSFVEWFKAGPVGPTGLSGNVIGFKNGSGGTLTCTVELYKSDKTTKCGTWSSVITVTATTPTSHPFTVDATALTAATTTERGLGLYVKLTWNFA